MLWDPRLARLVWVDIPAHAILWMGERDDTPRRVTLPDPPGCVVLREEGGYLAAAGQRLYALDVEFRVVGRPQAVADMPDATRFNDGAVDRHGGFVLGGAHLEETLPLCTTFYLSRGSIVPIARGFTVFNGPAFSPNGDRIYYTDSPTRRIMTAAYRGEPTRVIGPPEVFATLPADTGCPDGMTVDREGCLWNAHWDGARLTRYRPDGDVDRVIEVPVACPTSVCFGGRDLGTLFVTSAATKGSVPRQREDAIVDGDLLRLVPGVTGIAEQAVVVPA